MYTEIQWLSYEIKRYKDRHGDKWIQRYVYKYGDYT